MFCFRLLTAMTPTRQATLFVQNPRPSLQETLDFVDNQVIVENLTQKSGAKKTDTVHNIEETEKPKHSIAGFATGTTGATCTQLIKNPSVVGNAVSRAT